MKNEKYKTIEETNGEFNFFYRNINHLKFIEYLSYQLKELERFQKYIEKINTTLQKSESVNIEAINKKIREGNVSPNFKHPKHDTLTSENFISEYLQYLSGYKATLSRYIDSSSIYIDTMKEYFALSGKDQKEIGKHFENHKALKDHLSPEKYQKLTILFEVKSFLGKETKQFFLINNRIIDVSSEKGKAKYNAAVAQVLQQLNDDKTTHSAEQYLLNISEGNANVLQAPKISIGNVLQNLTYEDKQNRIDGLLKQCESQKNDKDIKHQKNPFPNCRVYHYHNRYKESIK